MDYTKMILTEHLVKTIINRHSNQKFDLIFRIDTSFYTGRFINRDEQDRDYTLAYNSWSGYDKNYSIFNIDYSSTIQKIRSSFFDFTFGPEKDSVNMENYISNPEAVLRNIINFVEQYDSEFLNPIVKDKKSIYNFNNINTGKSLDFYLLSDENMFPVSLIKQEQE